MSYKVHLFVKRPPSPVAVDAGEVALSQRPALIEQVKLDYEGKAETGVVEEIDPRDWEARGVVPKVTIVLNPAD